MLEELKKCAQLFLSGEVVLGHAVAESQGFSKEQLIEAIEPILAEEILKSMTNVESGSFIREDGVVINLSAFQISKFQFTNRWWNIINTNLNALVNDDLPKNNVSWDDVQLFIEKLNKMTGRIYRLPTESEWEYAARGGNKSKGYVYAGSNDINEVAWYKDNSNSKLHPVAQKNPNELGIYDMSGNVFEWCSDWFGDYRRKSQDNPTGPSSGTARILRGGSWNYSKLYCSVSHRNSTLPIYRYRNNGFRLVLHS
jgi:sulfatase modifying factor 1